MLNSRVLFYYVNKNFFGGIYTYENMIITEYENGYAFSRVYSDWSVQTLFEAYYNNDIDIVIEISLYAIDNYYNTNILLCKIDRLEQEITYQFEIMKLVDFCEMRKQYINEYDIDENSYLYIQAQTIKKNQYGEDIACDIPENESFSVSNITHFIVELFVNGDMVANLSNGDMNKYYIIEYYLNEAKKYGK